MKTLLSLILYFFSITCFSQRQKDPILVVNIHLLKQEKSEKWKTIVLYSGSIILNGIGDGLNDSKFKTAGHLFNAASIGTLIITPAIFNYQKDNWYWYALTYTCLRAGLFDITYNLTRNLPLKYTGSTSITDKFYNSHGGSPMFPRTLFFVLGFAIPIRNL
jgi:hypothetical protein